MSFISEDPANNHGKQYTIPLSALTITSGTVDVSGWPEFGDLASADSALVKALLASMLAKGLLTAPSS